MTNNDQLTNRSGDLSLRVEVEAPGAGPETTSAPPVFAFRPDIEGLRAVAVLLVVLYHARVPFLTGGYVGVDVFFVISGFLITGLLWRELRATGRIAFAAFYARRARRLLPAGVLVLVVTEAASWRWLGALRAREVLEDGIWAALFGANLRFVARGTDYFAADLPLSPLQHYWSLAVEEQFYMVWPLLLLGVSLVWRRGRRISDLSVTLALAGVFAVSLVLCLVLTATAQPLAFFTLPTRAWELACGAILAISVPWLRRGPVWALVLTGWAGVGAVVCSAVAFGEATAFPGVAALLPVLGTAAVIVGGCAAPRFGPGAVLAWRPLQAVGKVSYSWYLWHWPVLILAEAAAGRALSLAQRLGLMVASGVLAAITFVLVERPLRHWRPLVGRPVRSLAFGALLPATAVAVALALTTALPDLQGQGEVVTAPQLADDVTGGTEGVAPLEAVTDAVAQSVSVDEVPANLEPSLDRVRDDKPRTNADGCHLDFMSVRPGPCVYGDPDSSTVVVLFGDSHAGQWFPPLERLALARGWRLVAMTKSACPPVLVPVRNPSLNREYSECSQWREEALRRIGEEEADLVVLGTARHYGPSTNVTVYSPEWLAGLGQVVAGVRTSGASVVVLGATPLPGVHMADCVSQHLHDVSACNQSAAEAVDPEGPAAERLAVEDAGGHYLDVRTWICTEQECPPIVSNLLVFRDDNHLTTAYTAWLAPVLGSELERSMQAGRAAALATRTG